MGAEKLLASLAGLRDREGEAFERCVQAGGNPAEHLLAAEGAARKKNLT